MLEATGGHERLVVAGLADAGMPVAVVNPLPVRHFARSTGKLAKTDALDARMLALFGERMQPEPRPRPDATTQELASLLARRRQLREMQTAEQNRRPTLAPRLRPGLDAHLEWLREQVTQTAALPVRWARGAWLECTPFSGPGAKWDLAPTAGDSSPARRRTMPRGRTFRRECKLELMHQLERGERRPAHLCREHGLADGVRWRRRREYAERGEAAFAPAAPGSQPALERRIAELEQFCSQLALENAILKKERSVAASRNGTP